MFRSSSRYFIVLLPLAAFLASEQVAAEIPTEGLVAHYPFSGTADDASGNGNHGSVLGPTLTTDRFDAADQAYRFDGIDDFILASADNLPTTERTVALWYRADQLSSRPVVLGYGGGTCGTSWLMGINNGGGDRQYQLQGHCLSNLLRGGYGPEPIDRWRHWLITTDATGTRLYIDGVEHGSNANWVTNTNVAGKDLALGVLTGPGGAAPFTDVNTGYFDGKLDEVAIYARALEAGEIQAAFLGNLPTDYVLYYPFTGSASDQSGNANDGLVIGATLSEDRFDNPGSAYEFDGIDDYIRASASGLPTGERTVSLWFKADDVSGRPGLLGYGGGTCGTSWLMGINNGTGDNQYQLQGHCLSNLLRAGYAPEPVLSWQHVAFLTSSAGTRILVNGELVAANGNSVTNTNVAGRHFAIGVSTSPAGFAPFTDSNTGYFDGKLDDIVIYNRALNGDEIQSLINDGDTTIIFRSGFESGDTSQWTDVSP